MPLSLFISAGEASGDALGAALLTALRRERPDLVAFGMGGPRMRALGFEAWRDASEISVVGFTEVLRHLPRLFALRTELAQRAIEARPDVAVLIDVPDFNIRVAERVFRAGIPVVFYVGPSVWAWRAGRTRTYRRFIDRLLVLFPFELPVWRDAGVDVVCVGHPLADELPAPRAGSVSRGPGPSGHPAAPPGDGPGLGSPPRAERGEDRHPGAERPERCLALLPGSRRSELDRLLPVMLDAVVSLRRRGLVDHVVLPVAPSLDPEDVRARIERRAPELLPHLELVLAPNGSPEPRRRALAGASIALVASGTATLEVALAGVPQVIVYKVSRLSWWIGRALAKVSHLGLVNLIAGREIAPELLQDALTAESLAQEAQRLLESPEAREVVRTGYSEVRAKLGGANAAERAARAILELVEPGAQPLRRARLTARGR